MIVDQTDWGHIRATGADRVRFLQGMCTADVASLAPGGWTRASVLNPKGRVISVIEVVAQGDHLLISCEPSLTDKTLAALDKHVIMDDVAFEKVAQPMHRIWDSPSAVWDAPPVLAPPPGPPAPAEAVELRRIEAGMPRYGVDVGEDNFPFESLLARHIDYDKGCYLGQEPISRVHHRGGTSKLLRGLRVDGADPVAPGAAVLHAGREVGAVTSAVVSPDFGSIALAYIHRSAFEPGTEVEVAGRRAVLVELPFGQGA